MRGEEDKKIKRGFINAIGITALATSELLNGLC
jgi:hypothetical protein